MTRVPSFEMPEEVQPVDDVDLGSPGAGDALDPKTLAPMSYAKAAGIGRDNVGDFYNPGSIF